MTTDAHVPGSIPVWTQADRLRKARESIGWSQQELADAMDVSRGTISNAEGGKPLQRSTLRLWAIATGCPIDWLRDGTRAADQPAKQPRGGAGVRRRDALGEAPATGLEPVTCRRSARPARHLSIVGSPEWCKRTTPGSPERPIADVG